MERDLAICRQPERRVRHAPPVLRGQEHHVETDFIDQPGVQGAVIVTKGGIGMQCPSDLNRAVAAMGLLLAGVPVWSVPYRLVP